LIFGLEVQRRGTACRARTFQTNNRIGHAEACPPPAGVPLQTAHGAAGAGGKPIPACSAFTLQRRGRDCRRAVHRTPATRLNAT
jgi:hypothetical protein